MLMAGLDGIENKIDPGKPLDKDIFDLVTGGTEERSVDARIAGGSAQGSRKRSQVPDQGRCVFSEDLIDMWIEYKRKNEVDAVRMRPHPYEFHLYYDI